MWQEYRSVRNWCACCSSISSRLGTRCSSISLLLPCSRTTTSLCSHGDIRQSAAHPRRLLFTELPRETVWKVAGGFLIACVSCFKRARWDIFALFWLLAILQIEAYWDFPDSLFKETVWKVLGGRDDGLRSAPWRAGDTPRICPTTNGVLSARIFPSPREKDAPGCTA